MNTNFKLPEKWCIERNPRNFEEVNRLFKEINGKIYRADGTWRTAGGVFKKHDYLCFPAYEDKKYHSKRKPSGYTEVSLEQLKKYVMSKNTQIISKLPETWYVVVTEDIFSDAFRWRFDREYDEENSEYVLRNFKPGCIVGMYKWNSCDEHASKEWECESIDKGWGQEISAEDFRFHVLKKYNRQDWIEGRIAILRPLKTNDPLLDSFMKECNPINSKVIPYWEFKYLIANKNGTGSWVNIVETDLPIIKDIKEIYANENIMKNSKKIEYRVKEKFQKVSRTLYDTFEKDSYGGYGTFDYKSVLREQYENAGVLDIWFDAVECTPKLPEINGYEGKDVGDFIHYGCASLSKDWFTASANRHIRELTLSSGVKISADQMTQIREYLQK